MRKFGNRGYAVRVCSVRLIHPMPFEKTVHVVFLEAEAVQFLCSRGCIEDGMPHEWT